MKCANALNELRLQSPIGIIVVEFCSNGLHSVNQHPDINDSNFKPKLDQKVIPEAGYSLKTDAAKDCAQWLETYFNCSQNISKTKIPNLCIIDSSKEASYYDKVYTALLKVPFGKSVSYKELAGLAGSQNAVRAVGSAMARNPFQLVVPCHRVLPSPSASGKQSVGNYSSGKKVSVKQWLLTHEGFQIQNGFIL